MIHHTRRKSSSAAELAETHTATSTAHLRMLLCAPLLVPDRLHKFSNVAAKVFEFTC